MILFYYINYIKFQLMLLLMIAVSLFLFISLGSGSAISICNSYEWTKFTYNIFNCMSGYGELCEYIKNVSYSLVAAQIFYIFTVGIPGAYTSCRHAKIVLISLSKIISIVYIYTEYFIREYDIKDCNIDDLDVLNKYKEINPKVFSMDIFKVKCIRVSNGYNIDYNPINVFVETMKYKFMHHYNEVIIMSKSIDDDVLSCLFELKSTLDGINRINHIQFHKNCELCSVLGNIMKKTNKLCEVVDKKYLFLSKIFSKQVPATPGV